MNSILNQRFQLISCWQAAVAAILLVAGMMPSALAQTSALSLDLNNDAARLSWAQLIPARKARFDASVLHHQDRGSVLSGGFHITGNAATPERPLNAGLGLRANYVRGDREEGGDPDGYGVAIGGFFDTKIPNYDRLGFGGHIYYSPEILSFGDMDEYTDVWLYGSYSVLKQGDVYLGVRSVKGDFGDQGEITLDTGFHAGFTLKF